MTIDKKGFIWLDKKETGYASQRKTQIDSTFLEAMGCMTSWNGHKFVEVELAAEVYVCIYTYTCMYVRIYIYIITYITPKNAERERVS